MRGGGGGGGVAGGEGEARGELEAGAGEIDERILPWRGQGRASR